MLTNGNCALEFDDHCPFVTLKFENGLKYWNNDYSILIGHQFSILREIMVRYSSVMPKLRKKLYSRRQQFYHKVQLQLLGLCTDVISK